MRSLLKCSAVFLFASLLSLSSSSSFELGNAEEFSQEIFEILKDLNDSEPPSTQENQLVKKRPREEEQEISPFPAVKVAKLEENWDEVWRSYTKLHDRSQKIRFIHNLMLSKYQKATGLKRSNIDWSRITVHGWPEECKSLKLNHLSIVCCDKLMLNMREIRFEAKSKAERSFSQMLMQNQRLYS